MSERRIGKRGEQKRRWDEQARHPCADCPTLVAHNRTRCRPCDIHHKRARRRVVERRWNEGASLKEIAAELDTTVNAIGHVLFLMRQEGGWNIPYRYAVRGRRVVA